MKCQNCGKSKEEMGWQKGWDNTLFCSSFCWNDYFQKNKKKNKGKGIYGKGGIGREDLKKMRTQEI